MIKSIGTDDLPSPVSEASESVNGVTKCSSCILGVTGLLFLVYYLVALYVCEHMSGICFATQGLLLVVAMRAPESAVHLERQ